MNTFDIQTRIAECMLRSIMTDEPARADKTLTFLDLCKALHYPAQADALRLALNQLCDTGVIKTIHHHNERTRYTLSETALNTALLFSKTL